MAAKFHRNYWNLGLHQYIRGRAHPGCSTKTANRASGSWGEMERIFWKTNCVDSVIQSCCPVKFDEGHIVILSLVVVFWMNEKFLYLELLFGSLGFVKEMLT